MHCPDCRAQNTRVVDSRGNTVTVRRRRECESCGHRFSTYERVATLPPPPAEQELERVVLDYVRERLAPSEPSRG